MDNSANLARGLINPLPELQKKTPTHSDHVVAICSRLSGISRNARTVAIAIASHCHKRQNTWYAFPSNRRLSRQTGLCIRSIQYATKELAQAGLIIKEFRRNADKYTGQVRQTSNEYFLVLKRIAKAAAVKLTEAPVFKGKKKAKPQAEQKKAAPIAAPIAARRLVDKIGLRYVTMYLHITPSDARALSDEQLEQRLATEAPHLLQ